MDDKWMVDDRCHVFSAHFPSGNWSDLPDPPWSRTRPGPASSSSSSSSTATINMKSKLEVYDFQPRRHIYISSIFTVTSQQHPWIFQQNPAFFASSLARSRRWLCTNCRSRLANWLAQIRQTHLGRKTSVCTSQGPELEGGLFS